MHKINFAEDTRSKLSKMLHDPNFSLAQREDYIKNVLPTWLTYWEKLAPPLTAVVGIVCHISQVEDMYLGLSIPSICFQTVSFMTKKFNWLIFLARHIYIFIYLWTFKYLLPCGTTFSMTIYARVVSKGFTVVTKVSELKRRCHIYGQWQL